VSKSLFLFYLRVWLRHKVFKSQRLGKEDKDTKMLQHFTEQVLDGRAATSDGAFKISGRWSIARLSCPLWGCLMVHTGDTEQEQTYQQTGKSYIRHRVDSGKKEVCKERQVFEVSG